MPVPVLKALADKSGKSLADLERYWNDAKKQLDKKDMADDDYAYIMSIVKKRAGINESFLESKLAAKEYIEDQLTI